MSFEIDCDIKLRRDGEVIVDPQRAMFLKMIDDTGSLDRATEGLGVSMGQAKTWLNLMGEAQGSPIVTFCSDGKVILTDAGRSLMAEFETRSAMARSQVQNLWKKPWVTTDCIMVIEDRVVLIRRGREPFKGMYALPGGIVEYGESVEACVVREMEEETGLKTRVLDLVGVYSAADRDPRGHFITLAFNLQLVGGTLHGGDDAAEAALFPLENLPEMAADHSMILSDALLKRARYHSNTVQCGSQNQKNEKRNGSTGPERS
jgi:8-oxo-dGTP diphosphatase